MRAALVLLALLGGLPRLALAQAALTGIVRDSLTHEPLAFASVFLANTTLGATTTERGEFTFAHVPAGSYDLVASYVGYHLARRTVVVGSVAQQLTLALAPAASQLGEVVVRPHPNRASDYQKFTELFLGRTTFSRQCRIRNPEEVFVDYDATAQELTASARQFVQIDNEALGYRIKYYGLHFNSNFARQVVTFYGQPVFEEMTPRTERQQRRWVANRAQAYHGSLTHFLRSVHGNQVAAEGFIAQKLRLVPNPPFARADSLRRALLKRRLHASYTAAENDSLARWAKVPATLAMLYLAPRPLDSLRRVAANGRVFLRFHDYLQVSYLRASPDPLYQPLATPQFGKAVPTAHRQLSRLLLLVPEVEIQPNGQLTNPLAVFTEDYWGFEKMGEFLPFDYVPPPAHP